MPALAGLFLALPVAVLVVRAVLDGSLARALTAKVVLDALVLSLATTAVSLVITVAFGLPLAVVLARRASVARAGSRRSSTCRSSCRPRWPGSRSCSCSAGAGFLGGPLEALGLEIPFTTLAVILAQTFVSAPFFVRSARTGHRRRRPRPGGRRPGRRRVGAPAVPRITIPLAGAALAAGLVMSWARSLGEFGATIMFAGNVEGKTATLPLVVYGEFQGGDLDGSVAAAAILVIAAFGVLVAVRALHWGRVVELRAIG